MNERLSVRQRHLMDNIDHYKSIVRSVQREEVAETMSCVLTE